jgi:two-component sensor histidine kinase
MMTLYDRLYRSPDLGPVSLQEFLPSLAHDIAGVLKLDDSLSVEVRAEDVELDARLLQTLGVVMNELMTNSVKHAFPHVKSGQISITAQKEDSTVRIVYQDNGPGPPSADHIASSPGFGHELIEAMINQLGGTVHAEAASGMRVTLTVPVGR